MSNNNPHSHLNQTAQNSWNPLQIPSYIPRQPQLAHMSNERPMVRSPLAWHAAALPPDSHYNFMSAANHKNLEHSMNPLLPPYVRGPPPFDSMDLSLQSNRSAGSPLNKSAHSLLSAPPSAQLDYGHKLQAQQQHNLQQQSPQQMHTPNSFPIHNLSTNSPQTQQHASAGMPNVSTATATSSTPSSPAHNNAKFLSSNGSDCSEQQQPSVSLIPSAQNQSLSSNNGNNYMRDNFTKMPLINRPFDSDPHSKSIQKPVELVNKDCNYSSIMSNKMPSSHLQQHPTKKQSPLRSGNNSGYHVSQAQQQQQQQSPFNSPASNVKHNGPHTPPTPQSPSMHQQQQQTQQSASGANNAAQQQQQHQSLLHGGGNGNNNANILDYNQLHLHQPNNYQQSSHLPQQHLHHSIYSTQQQQQTHHHQHHQHWQQQQHMSTLLPPLGPMPTQTAAMQPPAYNSPLHTQQQQNTLTNLEPASSPASSTTPSSYAFNSSTSFDQRNPQASATAGTAAPSKSPPQNRLPQNIPDSAESPTTNASSEDDESSGGSGGGGDGQSNKPSTIPPIVPSVLKTKKSNSNSPASLKHSPSHIVASPMQEQSKSPKSPPIIHHHHNSKSPRKAGTPTPESLDLSSKNAVGSPNGSAPVISPPNSNAPVSLNDDSNSQMVNEKLKNGHTPPQPPTIEAAGEHDEVETIDKIAEMIAKTTSNSNSASQHSHHSHCSNSNDDVHSNGSSKSATRTELCESPKTKKQRQALKLRNAEQNTQDWSNNSASRPVAINDTESTTTAAKLVTTISSPLASNDDNAVLADELQKPMMQSTQQRPVMLTSAPQKAPLSPQSNSHSSSSSSSSSSCSNSSHSSYMAKSKENSNVIKDTGFPTKMVGDRTVDLMDVTKTRPDITNQSPLNLNCKTAPQSAQTTVTAKSPSQKTAQSPDKTKFEEVENKLQEMFAGIEDEPEMLLEDKTENEFNKMPANDQIVNDLSVVLELSNSLNNVQPTAPIEKSSTAETVEATATNAPTAAVNSSNSAPTQPFPIQTKAAKKSTVPSPIKQATPPHVTPSPTPTTNAQNNNETTTTTAAARKSMPRRRLSMAFDASNLLITHEHADKSESTNPTSDQKNNLKAKDDDVICILDDERPSTSAAAAVAAAAVTAVHPNTEAQNKSSNNNKGKSNPSTTTGNKTSGANKSNGGAGGGSSGASCTKATTKRAKSNNQKHVQQKKRKQSSSEDESVPPQQQASTPLAAVVANTAHNSANTSATTYTSSEKHKSPFILIKRDGSVSVVNAATAEDSNSDKQIKKGKKPPASYSHHERHHRIRGFHSSTLSQKYDADTTDSTWICVFCKRGPHRMGLGDLFGPYLVTADCEEYKNATNAPDALNLDEEFVNKRRRIDMVQLSSRGPPVVLATKAQESAASAATGINRLHKKKKKSVDEETVSNNTGIAVSSNLTDPLDVSQELFLGMTKVSENSYEVWLHEDCSVWAPDVYLVGARIMGLDAAVWNSIRYQCVICAKSGATICCLKRECKAPAHIPCARESMWKLDESDWHVNCQPHSITDSNQQQKQPAQHCTIPNQQTKNS